MKIEDLYLPMPNHPVDEKTFDLEKWRREKPMDYLMAAYLINTASNKNEVFSTIYNVTRLYIPDTLYKYFSLSEDPLLNKKKFDTLLQKIVYIDFKQLYIRFCIVLQGSKPLHFNGLELFCLYRNFPYQYISKPNWTDKRSTESSKTVMQRSLPSQPLPLQSRRARSNPASFQWTCGP